MLTHILIVLKLILFGTSACLQLELSFLTSPPCHTNYETIPKWKHVLMRIQLHCHQNDHASSQDQTLNGHFIYGICTWKVKEKLLQVQCYERNVQDLRMSLMFQKRKGLQEKGGCIRFARHTKFRSIGGMGKQGQWTLQLLGWNNNDARKLWQGLHHEIVSILTRQLSFLSKQPDLLWFRNLTIQTLSAPPDCGLAMHQLSGKKKEKFCITIGLACNADGTEKLEPIFIGKSSKPQCFKKYTPEQCGFYYHNNKKAWMTSSIFEEYVFIFPSNANWN